MSYPIFDESKLEEKLESSMKRMEHCHANLSVLARLYSLLKDVDVNLEKVCTLINSDGLLAGNVIRISNTFYYRAGESSKDVHSAIQKVGLNKVLRLVGIAMSKQVFMNDLSSYGISSNQYWLHSFLNASFCEALAVENKLDEELCYLAGLMHAIGRVVINDVLLKEKIDILWDHNLPHEAWEELILGKRYDDVGKMLLKRWGFSSDVIDLVANQCDDLAIQKSQAHAILNFVTIWSRENDYKINGDFWHSVPSHTYFDVCDQTEEDLERIFNEVIPSVVDVMESLEGDLND